MLVFADWFSKSVTAWLPATPTRMRVITFVLDMGTDSLSKVILTDPPQLLTYVNTTPAVAFTTTKAAITTPPANIPTPKQALLILGKSLFWDQQVGSDGQACASCHFQAGADPRSINVLIPGPETLTPPRYSVQPRRFQSHRLCSRPELPDGS